jgi:hypothetical protein
VFVIREKWCRAVGIDAERTKSVLEMAGMDACAWFGSICIVAAVVSSQGFSSRRSNASVSMCVSVSLEEDVY